MIAISMKTISIILDSNSSENRGLSLYAESRYAESHYAESYYAESRYAESRYANWLIVLLFYYKWSVKTVYPNKCLTYKASLEILL